MTLISNIDVNTLNIEDFAELFGTDRDADREIIETIFRNVYSEDDFQYRIASHAEFQNIILTVLNKIEEGKLSVAGPNRFSDWENGWAENYDAFVHSNGDAQTLKPGYYKDGPLRLRDDYIIPLSADFVYTYLSFLCKFLATKYFEKVDNVYEFGCGPGTNLIAIAEVFPKKKYYGLDWAPVSQKIMGAISKAFPWSFEGIRYNYFDTSYEMKLADHSGVLTFASLEQVGEDFINFVEMLCNEKPSVVVNVEPLYEYYDETNLLDYLGLQYHKRRGYLGAYMTYLRQLEAKGRIEILKEHNHKFGSTYNNSAHYIVWRPL